MFSVFKNINRFAGKSKSLDLFAVFCARLLPYLLVVFLLLYAVLKNNYFLFFYPLLCGVFSRFAVNELVHLFYKESRPADLGSTKILIPVPKNYSFPSGHASFFFGMSFLLLLYSNWLAVIFLICSVLIGLARVFSGVHWFRDILGGACAGILSAVIFSVFL